MTDRLPASSKFFSGDSMNVYMCVVCGLVYDEAAGWPEEGIAAGTPWAEVPPAWRCPECGVGKADFSMVLV